MSTQLVGIILVSLGLLVTLLPAFGLGIPAPLAGVGLALLSAGLTMLGIHVGQTTTIQAASQLQQKSAVKDETPPVSP